MSHIVRQALMGSVRGEHVGRFKAVVEDMVANHIFAPGECMVYAIAKKAAAEFGLGETVLRKFNLAHGWVSWEFEHTVKTPMPPPEKGKQPEDPVTTKTRYVVVKESAKVVAYREFLRTHEVEASMGGESLVTNLQRPQVTPPGSGSN